MKIFNIIYIYYPLYSNHIIFFMCPDNCLYIFILIAVLGIIIYFSNSLYLDSFLDYNINGKIYQVLDNNNSENAANILSKIDDKLTNLINFIIKKYQNIDNMNNIPLKKKNIIKVIIKRLRKTYNSDSLKENFPETSGKEVSYNLNKGNTISLCLRNFTNPDEFHQFNDILFVSIHELAHSCNISYGHDTSFWYIFRFLLENAIEANIYTNVNYRKNNVNYCSMKITYNPIFDKTLDDEYYLNKNVE